ncbi:LOW QUALITY PROTEIN: uncharacterized protein LOC103707421 [Phoenix dactylifera]|uniref:LOW QUALITY PROTEIN: uncharacterized protein LOC103707421 n=1 Tax=Phoenix dactylifera TaxID=42345 RepID=A0A8B9ADK3_PHODC|nr:LOW QUALITY PROTEIN: uncharacterized protein LOC103707421 [Phoenix dactylifera]
MAISCCSSPKSLLPSLPLRWRGRGGGRAAPSRIFWKAPELVIRASMVDSFESSGSFAKRMERAWLISQVPPTGIACSSCKSNGYIECKWCRGTGFFILGNNMLCEVPSRNTTCLYVRGRVLLAVLIAKATRGFRANVGRTSTTP